MNTTKKTRSNANPVYNPITVMKISKNKITLALALFTSGLVTAQTPCTVTPSSDKNYVTTEILQKEETLESNLATLKAPDKMTSVQYLDGLGRPLQTIQVNASTSLKDNVVFNVYDFAGRENKMYLPYTSSGCGTYISNALTAQSSFYNTTANIETTAYPFAETVFEPSPLNRVTTQGAAGADWQISGNHTVKYEYGTNAYQEVRNYLVLNTTIFYYAPNTLFKKIIKDENWVVGDAKNGTTEEFTDVEGQLILKRTYTNNLTYDTYYVYNSYGNLIYVIPPAARMTLVTGPVTASPVLNNLCYQYTYDNYNQMTGKKLPGKDWEYIAYDQLDRPVFTQDGNLRLQNKWLFTKYDAFGKVAYTGIYNSSATLQILQDQLNQKAAGFVGGTLYPLYETRLTTPINMDGKDIYYSNTAIPTTNLQLLSINYYDNYAFDLDGLTVPASVYGSGVTSQLTGMLTGTKVRVIEDVPTGYWTTTLMAYDSKARTVCSSVQNRYTGYTQKNEFKLDFTGKPTEITSTHTKGTAAPIVVIDQMSYDAAGRLSGHGEKVNSQVTERIGTNSYNELGQLITKYTGNSTSTSTHLQQLNYTYNIRGWLKQLNNTSSMGTDLFAYTLSYNSTQLTGSKAMYNGNISEASWKTTNDNLLRSYNYQYDKLNRITAANSLNTDAGRFSNTGITYDYNGNIMTMTRNGWQNSTTNYTNLDVLTYAYDGNKLLSVSDAGNKNYGFIDGNTSGNDYFYADMNGNLTRDKNKNITGITYNYLNLPQTIVFDLGSSNTGTLTFAYDANGVKQSKTMNTSGPLIHTVPLITQYAGSYVYEGTAGGTMLLQYFNQVQGYVRPINVGAQTAYQYVYQYKDHLGNNRLSYTDDDQTATVHLTLIEESNYDAFGMKHQGYNNVVSSLGSSRAQGLKYNGKELQEEYGLNWYDYGARFYDPAVGRWHVPDPLAVIAPNKTPYHFVSNNPLNRVDPRGLTDYQVNGKTRTINDGHNDVSMNVSERQFNRLQNKFDRGGSGYERMMNGLSVKNGFTTSSTYAESWASSGVGISLTQHQAGGDSYGQWSIQNNHQTYGIVEHVTRVADAGLGSVTDQFANINLGSNGSTYFRQNSGAIFRGNQYVKVTSAASRYSGLAKGAKIGGIAAGVVLGGYEVYQGYQQDGGHYGYNAQVQTAGAVGGLVGGLGGAKAGAAIGASVGAWFGGVGAVPGAIIGGLIGGGVGAWGGDYYGEQAAKAIIK